MNIQKIKIIYENNDYIIIDKPAGLITHGDGKNIESSVADQIIELYPHIKGVGETNEKYERSGIVHRLDKDTSGIMIISKTQDFYEFIKKQFQEHYIQKEYRALVYGHFKANSGYIKEDIGRSKNDFRKYVCGRHMRGEARPAETYYEVLNSFESNNEKYSYISAFPKTGRTHQIRVHMKHIHHGIVADSLYMSGHKDLGLKRHALHAYKITFKNKAQEEVSYICPLPEDMEGVLHLLF